MSVLNTTGSSIKSTTIESAIDELCTILAIAQKDSSKNPQAAALVAINVSTLSGESTYDIQIPLQQVASGTGVLFTVQNPFIGITYSSGGALTGGNPLQDLFNLCTLVETYESDPVRNTGNENRINVDINNSPWRAAVSLTLANTIVLNADGTRSTSVKPYLA